MSFDNWRKQVMSCFEGGLLGGTKAAFASQEAVDLVGALCSGRRCSGLAG